VGCALSAASRVESLGIKGAGEAGVLPGAAVLAAALEDAEGIAVRSMPLSPSDLSELRRATAAKLGQEEVDDEKYGMMRKAR
jgi:aerobic carbon-monoxide dehydrogenase large subunit